LLTLPAKFKWILISPSVEDDLTVTITITITMLSLRMAFCWGATNKKRTPRVRFNEISFSQL
ncbi:MAG: hypothetical protein ACRCUH_00985, partial [Shewanella sp.]